MKTFLTIATVFFILASLFQPVKPVLLGTYYYPWWGQRHWTRYTVSGQPLLGQYSSSDPKIAEQHIAWAQKYGIDFFVLSWFGPDSYLDSNIQNGFLKAKNIGQTKFAILYEPAQCLTRKIPIDFSDPKIADKFEKDFEYLAKKYFSHPSYFKIQGRPVVAIYVTRVFSGDIQTAVKKVRTNLKKLGFEIYLIGDEIWYSGRDEKRALLWDGLTAYNLYHPTLEKEGVKNMADFSQKIKLVYEDWQKFLEKKRVEAPKILEEPIILEPPPDLIPGIIPQYDDFKLRRNPPLFSSGPDDFKKMLAVAKQTASPIGPRNQKIILITSWNEWHEGTSIEPGENFSGEPFYFLKILKEWQ